MCFADTVLLLDRGEILDYGPHDSLLESCELYQSMWKASSSFMESVQEGEGGVWLNVAYQTEEQTTDGTLGCVCFVCDPDKGVLPAIRIFLFGYTVQQVISGVDVNTIIMLMFWFAAATIGEKVMEALNGVAQEGLRLHISRAAKALYIDRYNDVSYQELLNLSFSESAERAANGLDRGHRIITLALDVLSAAVTLISLGTALWFVTKIGCLVMIVTFAFVVLKQYKLGRQMFNVENQLANQRIRENYYRSTITDFQLGKERKLFAYSPYIVNLWRDTFAEISRTNQSFLLSSQNNRTDANCSASSYFCSVHGIHSDSKFFYWRFDHFISTHRRIAGQGECFCA